MLEPIDNFTKKDMEKGLRYLLREGLASHVMANLTGGVFIVAFALALGASNFMIGLLAAIPPLMQLLQLPSVYLIENIRKRKKITVYAAAMSRVFLLPLLLIAFLGMGGLHLLLWTLLFHSAFSAIATSSWNSWIKDLVPENRLGPFFSRRLLLSEVLSMILSLIAAFGLDYGRNFFPGLQIFGVLFVVAFLVGVIGVYDIAKMPEPKMVLYRAKVKILELLRRPLRDIGFRRLAVFLASLNFAVYLSLPFFTVYMLTTLGLNLLWVLGFQVLTQIVNILSFRIWGRFSGYHTNKSILSISTPLFLIALLGWTFTTLPDVHFLTMPLLVGLHILMGVSTAGIRLATGNIGFKLAPKQDSTPYLASLSFVNFLFIGMAPILGGLLADYFKSRQLSLVLSWTDPSGIFSLNTFSLEFWDFLFIISFIVGMYSLHRLTKVEERGTAGKEVRMKEFMEEVRKEIRNLSTISGFAGMAKFPALVVNRIKKYGRNR